MAFHASDLDQVAHLARLNLNEGHETLLKDICRIMDMIDQIEAVKTPQGIPAMEHPFGMTQRMHADEVTEMEQQNPQTAIAARNELQRVAALTEAGLYLVNKVIE